MLNLGPSPLLPTVQEHWKQAYSPVRITACDDCGHWYNRDFDGQLSSQMYRQVVTNSPVDPSMFRNLQCIADWLGEETYAGKQVLEVGGGSGHFARLLAARANFITVYEPSTGLEQTAFPEPNLRLITDFYRPGPDLERVDLVVCRQVLEHVADPVSLLGDMAAALKPGGLLYVEVPRAEFIREHAVVIEFHNAHVQYFLEGQFPEIAARAGLQVVRCWTLKEGHDMGYLLGNGEPRPLPARPALSQQPDFQARIEREQRLLENWSGKSAIYGANWQGTCFFHLYRIPILTCALDDTPAYRGSYLEGRFGRLPILAPAAQQLKGLKTIFVTAHLHFKVIEARLRSLGFDGIILNAISIEERT